MEFLGGFRKLVRSLNGIIRIIPDKRSKPDVVENIPKSNRKDISVWEPSDLWTTYDDLVEHGIAILLRLII